jgi:hypothetical protein
MSKAAKKGPTRKPGRPPINPFEIVGRMKLVLEVFKLVDERGGGWGVLTAAIREVADHHGLPDYDTFSRYVRRHRHLRGGHPELLRMLKEFDDLQRDMQLQFRGIAQPLDEAMRLLSDTAQSIERAMGIKHRPN